MKKGDKIKLKFTKLSNFGTQRRENSSKKFEREIYRFLKPILFTYICREFPRVQFLTKFKSAI